MRHNSVARILTAMLASFSPLIGCAHGGWSRRALDRMVDSERAFCRLARETSVKEAFLQYLSDDAVMLLPRPANGKQAYAARPASPSGLSWEPSFALISAAGDLGCTFGPWEFRKHRDQDTADAYGHFVSVWQLQTDGEWKVVFDSGISHERPPGAPAQPTLRSAGGDNKAALLDPREQLALSDRLLVLDRSLSDTAVAASEKLLPAMSDEVVVFFESHYPVSGKPAAGTMLRGDTAAYSWQPARAVVSTSGDLGYVYGTANLCSRGESAGEIGYLRIWERGADGTWAIIVQKINPVED